MTVASSNNNPDAHIDKYTNPYMDIRLDAKRNLKFKHLAEQYTEEEIAALLDTADYDVWTPPNDQYEEPYAKLLVAAGEQDPKKVRKWHPKEDAFLKATYMYLTDVTVSLALNIPVNMVLARRRVLGLTKKITDKLQVMIWCERDAFEKDMEKYSLNKGRPDVDFMD